MSRSDSEARITLSVLDRLLDSEPGSTVEAPPTRARSLRALKSAVRRDLEWLLNTRRSILPLPPNSESIERSLMMYGLPDFSAASVKSQADQARILRTLREAITLFEPRLRDVSVSLLPGEDNERSMRFRIEAQLQIDPAPEPVTFDTQLQLYTGTYEIKEEE
jgi:type VI secretion system protein ImpF